jgi:hypothetical protein
MTTTSVELEENSLRGPYLLAAIVHLKEGIHAGTPVKGKSTLSGIAEKVVTDTLGSLAAAYTHSKGHLVISVNTPKIVSDFLWAAPDSLNNAVFDEETKEKFGIERVVIIADLTGVTLADWELGNHS